MTSFEIEQKLPLHFMESVFASNHKVRHETDCCNKSLFAWSRRIFPSNQQDKERYDSSLPNTTPSTDFTSLTHNDERLKGYCEWGKDCTRKK